MFAMFARMLKRFSPLLKQNANNRPKCAYAIKHVLYGCVKTRILKCKHIQYVHRVFNRTFLQCVA